MSSQVINEKTKNIGDSGRKYRSIPTEDMVIENNVQTIMKYQQCWKSGTGHNYHVDFRELEQYCTSEHTKWLLTRFDSSGWNSSTKASMYPIIRRVLVWKYAANDSKGKVSFSTEICSEFILANYLSMISCGTGLSGKTITGKTLGRLGAILSSCLTKFGLKPIPREKRNLDTYSGRLDSNNYSIKELKTIGRALLRDRKALLKKFVENLPERKKEIIFDKLIYNAVFLTIYYLGSGQTETINMYIDDKFKMKKMGGNRLSIMGVKSRNNYKNNEYNFTPRQSCKTFFESHLTFLKEHPTELVSKTLFLFRRLHGASPSQVSLRVYVRYLRRTYDDIDALYQDNPTFRLNCSLLKSTIKQKMEAEKGRLHASLATRNSPNTFDTAKYSKTTETDAKRQLAIGVTTLQYLGENPSGGTKVAIARTKELIGNVLTPEEFNLLKSKTEGNVERITNGGFCKGNESPQRNEFQKNMNKNELLSDDDKSHMGCGFVVKCFSCKNFGVVDDSNDIWRLLSFEQRLNEAMTLHKDLSHFIQNYGEIKLNIVELKKRFKKSNLKAAEMKLKREIHPIWDENSIEDILRG
jgi:hypothetical protein